MPDDRCRIGHYQGTPESVAQRLLGCKLVRNSEGQHFSGIIVEVEAYLSQEDLASHSARGLLPRNRSMFLPAGHLYVYAIHSRHCLNVVTESAGFGSAVLIRAIEPLEGLSEMARRRKVRKSVRSSNTIACLRALTAGPGRLCEAIHVGRGLDGIDLLSSPEMWIEPPPVFVSTREWRAKVGQRIGISQSAGLPLRWFIDGHQLVSGKAADHSAGRYWRFAGSAER